MSNKDTLEIGDEVVDSPVGAGTITGITEVGFPQINHIAVAWCLAEAGLFDPRSVAPQWYREGGYQAWRKKLAQKPRVQAIMDLARKFRSAPGGSDYDDAYKALERAVYDLSMSEPLPVQDERQTA